MLVEPEQNCGLCPRLCEFRAQNRVDYRSYYNSPVPSFGDIASENLIVGLAPGLHGANQTARPFTGDYAGDVLYAALIKVGLASGIYEKHKDDGLQLKGVRITNAVRCVPPENKPNGYEVSNCNQFLRGEILQMPNLKRILVLGSISHNSTLKALGLKQSQYPFKHKAKYQISDSLILISSYHTSRYNINTGRLTNAMFDEVIEMLCA
jgi:uracil-DNA glycosylase family 4